MSRSPRKHQDARTANTSLRRFLEAAEAGRIEINSRVYGRGDELGLSVGEVGTAVRAIVQEILANVLPMPDPWDPPGHAFVWDSKFFGRKVYLKFRLEGRRPKVILYSLHPAD